MKCHQCEFDNPPGAKFCCECGARLPERCAACQESLPPQAKFCPACGAAVNGVGRPPAPPAAPAVPQPLPPVERAVTAGVDSAERRQLTVMFCDLLDSTALSARLDPEDLRSILHDYQAVCGAMIRRYEGHVAQYLGDGLLVYFGFPRAHEDDAQRAVRAGLGILEAMETLNPRLAQERGVRLAVRLGIHTGLVVVGRGEGGDAQEPLALGETPNIAARLQGLAEPGTVVISAATHKLVAGFFECQPGGTHALKGVPAPVEIHRVLHESTARSRLEVAGPNGLTPLVGREQELTFLLERWERVKDGQGQVVIISGEAGIGKSRLVQAMKEHVAQDPGAWLTPCQCSPYHQNSTLYPFIDLLSRVTLQLDRAPSPRARLHQLEGFLLQYGFALPETVPLFAALLSIPLSEDYPPLRLSAEQQRQKTLQALQSILIERAAQQPLLFVVEDLQWVDPSTLELLNRIVDQGPTVRVMALFTCRADFAPAWSGRSHVTRVSLTRLTRKQIRAMVERITQGKSLPAAVFEQLVAKTDGVPLFVEELTKMILESGLLKNSGPCYELGGPLPPLAIPATLQDSLMARLDRLNTVKEVAQLGAVLGREFTYELLRKVAGLDEPLLQRALLQLVEVELMYQRGGLPQASFLFKHALIQDAAYQSLLKSKRQHYHQRIAQALEESFPETARAQPELVAHHYAEAGLAAEAIPQWRRAGELAAARSAHTEAVHHFQRALQLLQTLPETPERQQQEVQLQICLGAPLTAIKGYGALEVEQTYTRARELCQKVSDTGHLFHATYGLCRLQMLRAQYGVASEQGELLLRLAQKSESCSWLVAAHRALGAIRFYQGHLATSRQHVEHVIAATMTGEHAPRTLIQDNYDVVDPRVTCLSYLAWNLWLLGYPDQARRASAQAIELGRSLKHPFSLVLALSFAAWLHQFCRDLAETQQHAAAALALANEQGFPFWIGWVQLLQGWAEARNGHRGQTLADMEAGLALWRAKGSELGRAYFLCLLAEVHGEWGQASAAVEVLGQAQVFAQQTGEMFWEAERLRLQGELALRGQNPDPVAAERYFRAAIDAAHAQQARSLELRACLSLNRLLQPLGQAGAARRSLAEIYGWFTEGYDTADLQEAKARLDSPA